jgi:hypothetical protein
LPDESIINKQRIQCLKEDFFTKAEPGEDETPAESADKVRPHNANLDLKREEAHWPPAASEDFPKLGPSDKRDFLSRQQIFMV